MSIIKALTELGDRYYTRPLGDPGNDPFYTIDDEEMSITLKRRGEGFEFEWLEKAREVATEEGYTNCTVELNQDGHLKILFTR